MSSFYESLTNEQCEARLKNLEDMLQENCGEVPPAWLIQSHVDSIRHAKTAKLIEDFFSDFPIPTLTKFRNILRAKAEIEMASAEVKTSHASKLEPSFSGGTGGFSPEMPVPVPGVPEPEITRVQASVKKKPKTSKKAQT